MRRDGFGSNDKVLTNPADDLDCAISLARPTNLATDAAFSTDAAAIITAAFGPEGDGVAWAENSPALQVGDGFAAKTLLAVAADDELIAASQLARASSRTPPTAS